MFIVRHRTFGTLAALLVAALGALALGGEPSSCDPAAAPLARSAELAPPAADRLLADNRAAH